MQVPWAAYLYMANMIVFGQWILQPDIKPFPSIGGTSPLANAS